MQTDKRGDPSRMTAGHTEIPSLNNNYSADFMFDEVSKNTDVKYTAITVISTKVTHNYTNAESYLVSEILTKTP